MRVALVINVYDPARGGVERYAETLSRALLDAGHEVHVIASSGTELPEGVHLHRVKALTFWSPLKIWSFADGARRVLEREKSRWDAVLGLANTPTQHVYRAGAGSYRAHLRATSAARGRILGDAIVGLNPRHRARFEMERRIFEGWRTGETRRYLFNSRHVRDEILEEYDIPPDRIDVLSNPVDTVRFDPARWASRRDELRHDLGIPQDAYVLLFAGGGFHRKGLDLAISALADAASEAWLIVAGRGDRAPYKALAVARGIADRVIFAGVRADIESVYAGCDALLAPTRYDAFSNATIEGLAMGLPAITTRANGASDIIDEGREGFIIEEATDTRALAKALDALAEPARRKEMGARARLRAETLSPRVHADGVIKVLEAAVMMDGGGKR